MELKEQIEKILKSLNEDKTLMESFKKNPVDAVKKLIGSALPQDILEKIVAGVKAKLGGEKLADAASALGKLFGK